MDNPELFKRPRDNESVRPGDRHVKRPKIVHSDEDSEDEYCLKEYGDQGKFNFFSHRVFSFLV
jgi:hypothetical protein